MSVSLFPNYFTVLQKISPSETHRSRFGEAASAMLANISHQFLNTIISHVSAALECLTGIHTIINYYVRRRRTYTFFHRKRYSVRHARGCAVPLGRLTYSSSVKRRRIASSLDCQVSAMLGQFHS